MVLANGYWAWKTVRLFYLYKTGLVLYVYMTPDWLLTLTFGIHLLGGYWGLNVLFDRLPWSKGLLYDLGLLLFLLLANYTTGSYF